jgi:hypothetical protein
MQYFPGNANLANLTAAKQYTLRVDLTDWADNSAYAKYSNFIIGGASTNYTLKSLGIYSGTAGVLCPII